MSCFKCLDLMKAGSEQELKEVRSECLTFRNNQCTHLGADNSFHQRIQDSCVRLFPDRLKTLLDRYQGTIATLAVVLVLTAFSVMTYHPNKYVPEIVVKEEPTAVESILTQADEFVEYGDYAGAFDILSDFYVANSDDCSSEELRALKRSMLYLGRNAVEVRPSELYTRLGVSEEDDITSIVKIQGFITEVQQDSFAGSRLVVSDTTDFEAKSLIVQQPVKVNSAVEVGDEVVFLCVPKFVNIATPIVATGWVQP